MNTKNMFSLVDIINNKNLKEPFDFVPSYYKYQQLYCSHIQDKVEDFVPYVNGMLISLCEDNFFFVSQVVFDICSYLDKKSADYVLSIYMNAVIPLIELSPISTLVHFNRLYENFTSISDVFYKIINDPLIIRSLKKSSVHSSSFKIEHAINFLRKTLAPESVKTIIYGSTSKLMKTIVGYNPAILRDVQLQVKWIKSFIHISVIDHLINIFYITDDAIDLLNPEESFRLLEKIHMKISYDSNFYDKQQTYFTINKLIDNSLPYVLVDKDALQQYKKIKTEIERIIQC